MVSITNIKRSSNDINLTKSKFKKLQSMVPNQGHKIMSFEMKGVNYSLANAIRRVLTNELPMKHMTVSLTSIKSTDKYIIDDVIHSRLEMIPIPQDIPLGTEMYLAFENKEDTYCDVLASEIKLKSNGSEIKNMMKNIPLCSLNAQHSLSVQDIVVAESYGYNNARVSPARIEYEIINHDMTQSSIASDPNEFRFLIESPPCIDPDWMMKTTILELTRRLDAIDRSNYVVEFGIYKLLIPGETHTIGRLLSRYIFDLVPSIEYVHMRITHPSINECVLDVKHAEAPKLVEAAITEIKKDLLAIAKCFK
jgi:DNA-directed RNA polymerase subunit L